MSARDVEIHVGEVIVHEGGPLDGAALEVALRAVGDDIAAGRIAPQQAGRAVERALGGAPPPGAPA